MGKSSPQLATGASSAELCDVLPRERLFGQLDELRKRPILWIGGPPGAGKTTLIASYLGTRRIAGVWSQIENGDSELPVLLTGGGAGARLAASGLRAFYGRLPQPAVLVLDDCHEVARDASIHASIVDSAAEIPERCNFVLIGRGEPPPAYTRLIANRTLGVLDSRELRLTREETRAIACAASPEEAVVEALHEECGGWAAGVAIALERLRRKIVQPQYLRCVIRQALFDYFSGEVFDRASEEERRILVATALLPRVSAQVAEEVSGQSRAPVLLKWLGSRQVFTFPTAGDHSTYEYTPLFRDFLLSRLEDVLGETEFRDVAARAGAILERCGELDASMALRARIGDWKSLLDLTCTHGIRLLGQGHSKALRKWLAAFPRELAAASPWLSYWSGAAALAESPVAARAALDNAWVRFEETADRPGQMLTAAAMLETYQSEWSTHEPAGIWIDRLETCLAAGVTFPSREAELRVLASLLFARVHVRPALERSATYIARLQGLLNTDLEVNQRLFAARALLVGFCSRMDIDSARELAARMRAMLEEPECTPAVRAAALNAIAYSLWLAGALDEARCALQQAVDTAAKESLAATDALHHLTRQLVAAGGGDAAELAQCIEALRRVMDPTCHLGMTMLSSARARLAALRGESEVAMTHWGAAAARADEAGVPPLQWTTRLALAAALAAQGESTEATRVLRSARALLDAGSDDRGHRDHELVSAYLALQRGDRGECHRLLRQAFGAGPLASQAFALFPCEMAELCLEALRSGIDPESVRELIWRYQLRPPAHADDAWPWPFKVSLLGRFRLLKNDAPIRFSRRTQRRPLELLQALIAFGGTEVGVGVLTDALWPDSEGDAGYHTLESALYRLRQLLGAPGAVTLSGGKLSLDRRQFWVDVWALESELRQVSGDAAQAAARLLRMRQLYAGHFLEHESERPWALQRRQMLRERFVRSVRDVARSYESRRLWQEAINVYQIGIEVDSLAEDFHRGLIVCHRELGDHAAALQAYRRCSELLIKVLGVQPNAKTLAIYQSVRVNAVAQAG